MYLSISGQTVTQKTIEKSRFITTSRHVESEEEAKDFISEISAKYRDATHNCYAYVCDETGNFLRFSDDGEPQGTSGAPMVQMLVHEGITNVCIVVTRYFGGVKLGTGGLVRAYTSSAKLGLAEAGICDVVEMQTITYQVDYAVFNKIQNFPFTFAVNFDNIIYADTVTFDVITDPSDAGALRDTVTGLSGGKAIIISEEISPQKIER